MNCHSVLAVLDLHAEGRLSSARAKSVASHLAACAECRMQPKAPAAAIKAPSREFKERLAAAMKAERKAPRGAAPSLELWPRDLKGVAAAAAALALAALCIGWSGVPSERDVSGEELAAGRFP